MPCNTHTHRLRVPAVAAPACRLVTEPWLCTRAAPCLLACVCVCARCLCVCVCVCTVPAPLCFAGLALVLNPQSQATGARPLSPRIIAQMWSGRALTCRNMGDDGDAEASALVAVKLFNAAMQQLPTSASGGGASSAGGAHGALGGRAGSLSVGDLSKLGNVHDVLVTVNSKRGRIDASLEAGTKRAEYARQVADACPCDLHAKALGKALLGLGSSLLVRSVAPARRWGQCAVVAVVALLGCGQRRLPATLCTHHLQHPCAPAYENGRR